MNGAAWLYGAWGLLVWIALVGRPGPIDALLGLAVVACSWALFQRVCDPPPYISPARLAGWVRALGVYLLGFVAVEMARATMRVFWKVLAPQGALRPAIVAVEVPGATPATLVLLAYGVSLTPGEQIVDLDEARRVMYIHCLDAPDPEAVRQRIRAVHARYLEEVTRW